MHTLPGVQGVGAEARGRHFPGRQAAWPKLPSCSGKSWKGQSVAQRCSALAALAGAIRQADKPVWSLAQYQPSHAASFNRTCTVRKLGLRENGLEKVPKGC